MVPKNAGLASAFFVLVLPYLGDACVILCELDHKNTKRLLSLTGQESDFAKAVVYKIKRQETDDPKWPNKGLFFYPRSARLINFEGTNDEYCAKPLL